MVVDIYILPLFHNRVKHFYSHKKEKGESERERDRRKRWTFVIGRKEGKQSK